MRRLDLTDPAQKRAHFNPLFQSMTTGMVNEAVDGLVVLEAGLKDVAKEAQLNGVVVLGHADGWAERVGSTTILSPFSAAQIWLLS